MATKEEKDQANETVRGILSFGKYGIIAQQARRLIDPHTPEFTDKQVIASLFAYIVYLEERLSELETRFDRFTE